MKRTMLLALVMTLAVLLMPGFASAYYNPTVGRWITRDPIGYADGTSQYAYCSSRPALEVDPTGRNGVNWAEVVGHKPPPVDEIEANYRKAIQAVRDKGNPEYSVMADNLEYFMSGAGGVKNLPAAWLRSWPSVKEAEDKNEKRFIDDPKMSIATRCAQIQDGKTETFEDYWDAAISADYRKETGLYYASGNSTLRSRGTFSIAKYGGTCCVSGEVEHHWYDMYAWSEGAFVPNLATGGLLYDDDAIALEKAGKAKSFLMESYWHRQIGATNYSGKWVWGGPDIKEGKSEIQFAAHPFSNAFLKKYGLTKDGTPSK